MVSKALFLLAIAVSVSAASKSTPVYVPKYSSGYDYGYADAGYGGYGHGGYGHGSYGYGGYGDYGQESYGYADHGHDSYGKHSGYEKPRPYHYEYAIDDPHYGPMMAQKEEGDAYGTKQGYYVVNLPDGRTQHVKYTADDYGYNAVVSYDGYAQYPTTKYSGEYESSH